MKVQVSEATPIQLNWMVAKCKRLITGDEFDIGFIREGGYTPSTNWAQGGPIIEQQGIALYLYGDYQWNAHVGGRESVGPTALIAATRCYVVSELGDEVDVPDELI